MKPVDEYPDGLKVAALALIEHALLLLKKMPFTKYNVSRVVKTMVHLEAAQKELAEADDDLRS